MAATDYVAHKISHAITVDGDVTKPEWQAAAWSRRFVDMVTGAPGLYNTQAALLWNATYLYIAFRAEEPFVSATITQRDGIVFLDNDLELFIDGGDCYYELEVNAANTVYEVFFIWRDAFAQPRFARPEFNVHDPRTFTFAGDYDRTGPTFWRGTHPRGARWAFTAFDLPGLQTAVQIDGTLNDDTDIDRGWSLEIAIPWASLHVLAGGRALPPRHGDEWRMFLGRFQKLMLSGHELQPHPAMALTPHGVYDTHQPEKWSTIRFEE